MSETDDGWFGCTHRQTASASKYRECRPSMMTISWCLSKKHSTADSGVRAMLHLNPARSHAHQKASLWLSSLAKTSNTWARQRRRESEVLLVGACERSTVFHPGQCCVTMELRCEIPHGPGRSGRLSPLPRSGGLLCSVTRPPTGGRMTSPALRLLFKHISTHTFSQVSEMWKTTDI